jgi:diguanylate cyclase (GGDEF)-like protein/PAS domain S-box-containing protein
MLLYATFSKMATRLAFQGGAGQRRDRFAALARESLRCPGGLSTTKCSQMTVPLTDAGAFDPDFEFTAFIALLRAGFQETLGGLAIRDANRRRAVMQELDRAVAALLAGDLLPTTIRGLEAELGNVFPDDPRTVREILVGATSVLVGATMQAGGRLDSRMLETALGSQDGHATVRLVRDGLAATGARALRAATPAEDISRDLTMQALLQTKSIGILVTGVDGKILQSNQRMLDILGSPAGEIVGTDTMTLIRSRYHVSARQLELIAAHLDGSSPQILVESAIERPDGSVLWTAADSMWIGNERGDPRFVLTFVIDTSDSKAAFRAERDSEERIRALIQNSSDVIAIISVEGEIAFVSDSIERILGYDPSSLVGKPVFPMLPEDDHARLAALFERVLGEPRATAKTSARVAHADTSWRWMEIDFTNLSDVPNVGGIVVTARDITARTEVEQQLERLAYYDPLTSLPNRMHFRQHLGRAMSDSAQTGRRVAVVFIDLDHFKMVNDRYGHDAGDSALVAVGRRIMESLEPGEIVARLGGDEFAVLIEAATPSRALRTADRITGMLAQPYPDQARALSIHASAGVAISSPLLSQPAELLRAADIALYSGKATGGGVATMFTPSMFDEAFARAELERDLRLALDKREIVPYFQPEYALATGDLCCLEVLMRWRRANGQTMPPDEFLEIASELSIVVPLGLAILRDACRCLVKWHSDVPQSRTVSLSFNVSQREIMLPDYPDRIAEALADTGLRPELLSIEIDDRLFREPIPELDQFVHRLRAIGVEVVLDNFDGGYASWSRLRRLEVSHAKIDRNAIALTDAQDGDLSVLKAIVSMASATGIALTAVGLASEELVQRARDLGCDRGQGNFLSPPLAEAEVVALWSRPRGPSGA